MRNQLERLEYIHMYISHDIIIYPAGLSPSYFTGSLGISFSLASFVKLSDTLGNPSKVLSSRPKYGDIIHITTQDYDIVPFLGTRSDRTEAERRGPLISHEIFHILLDLSVFLFLWHLSLSYQTHWAIPPRSWKDLNTYICIYHMTS
jgi:hypothetical protein